MIALRHWLWDMVCNMGKELIKSIVVNQNYLQQLYYRNGIIWFSR